MFINVGRASSISKGVDVVAASKDTLVLDAAKGLE